MKDEHGQASAFLLLPSNKVSFGVPPWQKPFACRARLKSFETRLFRIIDEHALDGICEDRGLGKRISNSPISRATSPALP